MITGEMKKFLNLFATLGGILIILNAIIALLMAAIVGSVTVGVITVSAVPALSAVGIIAIFAIAGIVLGIFVILESNEAMRVTDAKDHWKWLIILGVIAFVIANGFVIGAVLVFLVGLGGYLFESGLDPFNILNLSNRRCPSCGTVVSSNARYCPSCGTSLHK